jgi:hypothetical protein
VCEVQLLPEPALQVCPPPPATAARTPARCEALTRKHWERAGSVSRARPASSPSFCRMPWVLRVRVPLAPPAPQNLSPSARTRARQFCGAPADCRRGPGPPRAIPCLPPTARGTRRRALGLLPLVAAQTAAAAKTAAAVAAVQFGPGRNRRRFLRRRLCCFRHLLCLRRRLCCLHHNCHRRRCCHLNSDLPGPEPPRLSSWLLLLLLRIRWLLRLQ